MTLISQIEGFLQGTLGVSSEAAANIWQSLLLLLLLFLMRWLSRRLAQRRVTDIARRYVFLKAIGYIVGFVAIVGLGRIWLGGRAGMAAYLGILSAGLAIALQDPLTNLAGWLFITLRQPFKVRDRIEIGGNSGDVIDIRLFQFSIIEVGNRIQAEQSTGRIIHIPNGWVFKHAQANFTEGFSIIWTEIPVTVTFESDWKKAKEILHDIGCHRSAVGSERAADEMRRAARKYLIFYQHLTPIVWTSVADHGVTLTLRCLTFPRQRRSMESLIWEDLLERFGEEPSVELAYPTTRFYDRENETPPAMHPPDPDA